jgi:hypothetical protein
MKEPSTAEEELWADWMLARIRGYLRENIINVNRGRAANEVRVVAEGQLAFVTVRTLFGIELISRHAEHVVALNTDAVDDRHG